MNKIKEARMKSGLKVNKIAKELGIVRSHYYNFENGVTKITEEKAEILSRLISLDKESVIKQINEGN